MSNHRRNAQLVLPIPEISEEDIIDFKQHIREIYDDIKAKFVNLKKFEDVLNGSNYTARDTSERQRPEPFARENIIQPIFSELGYNWTSETRLAVPGGDKDPDYILKPAEGEQFRIYVEAEPLNVRLVDNRDHGMDQVEKWLFSTFATSSYGIATDGFKWILGRLNRTTHKVDIIFEIDLTPVFQKCHNPKILVTENDINKIIINLLYIKANNFLKTTGQWIEKQEDKKDEISKKFYQDYVKYIFGVDEEGQPIAGISLLTSIQSPRNVNIETKNLFAVIFMNRLLFIKFLEERNLIPKDLLKNIHRKYQQAPPPVTFYKSYLTPLFYDVLNRQQDRRSAQTRQVELFNGIPYLNGGLFRTNIINEREYDIHNDGVSLILTELIEKYKFSGPDGLDPDILGYVFEKTINYISGKGNEAQRLKGSFYTPDFVVDYITEETLFPIALSKIFDGLRQSGWTECDLHGYDSIDDVLKNTPHNPVAIQNILKEIEKISILDPACGSGHFLTTSLSELLRLKEILLKSANIEYNRYDLKWEIITKNLYGVDIDNNAVEIARLRLWLSLIEEVKTQEHIKTLPNIDFNIVSGNAIVGLLNEDFESPLIENFTDEYIEATLDNFAIKYPEKAEEIRDLFGRNNLSDLITAYYSLIKLYTHESGSCAEDMQKLLGKIRSKLYNQITNFYLRFIQENGDFSIDKLHEIGNNINFRLPFHWKVDFSSIMNSGGFDIVIGNPPYIEDPDYDIIDELIIKTSKSMPNRADKRKYPLFYVSRNCGNTFAYFLERSLSLLKENGKFGFIVPTSWLGGPKYFNLRTIVLNDEISKILTLPYNVFKQAYIDNLIIIITKTTPDEEYKAMTYEFHKRAKINKIEISDEDYYQIKQKRWSEIRDKKIILNPTALDIFEKIMNNTPMMFQNVIEITRGVRFKRDLLTDKQTSKNSHLFFEGDINRYLIELKLNKWVEYGDKMDEYPRQFCWFEGERILLRRLVNRKFRLMSTLVNETFITNKNIYSILPKNSQINLKVILALLNSKLISYLYITQITQAVKDDFPQVTIDGVRSLPIPDLEKEPDFITSIVLLVNTMLSLTTELMDAENKEEKNLLITQIISIDNQIDDLVFNLYNLEIDDIQYINSFFESMLTRPN